MTLRLSGDWPAPTDYLEATADEVAWRRKADEAAGRRVESIVRMRESGMSYRQIARTTGLSPTRIQQLVIRSLTVEDESV